MSDLTIFSKIEADRVLKRAAEIEGSDDAGPVTWVRAAADRLETLVLMMAAREGSRSLGRPGLSA